MIAMTTAPLLRAQSVAAGDDPRSLARVGADELGEGDYARRQSAMRRLWSERETMREAVQRAARHSDPEVASRARWILQQWQQGVLPDIPPEVLKRLADSEGIERLQRLLEAGQFHAVIVAAEQAATTAEGPSLRDDISDLLQRRFAFFVRTAEQTNQFDAFCDLLDVATESPALAVARAELLTRLGFDLAERGELPESARRWSETQRARTTVLIRATRGDVPAALEAARQADQEDMVRACLLLLGDWEALIGEPRRQAEAAPPGSLLAYRSWSDVLVAAARAGQDSLADQAAEQLAEPAPTEAVSAADRPALELRWRSLLIHGYVEPALRLLRSHDPADAAEVLGYLGRFDEAFEVLGIRRESFEQDLRSLAAEVQKQVTAGEPKGEDGSAISRQRRLPAMDRALMAAKLLLRVGEDLRAKALLEEVAGFSGGDGDTRTRDQAVVTLWQMGQSEEAFALAVPPDNEHLKPMLLYELLRWMTGRDEPQARALASVWEALLQLHPEISVAERLQWIAELQRGEIPWDTDRDGRFRRLFDRLQSGKPTVRRFNGRLVVTGRGYASAELGDFFLRLGQTELARQIYQQRSAAGDSAADLQLARLELSSGSAADAYEIYRRVWLRHSSGRGESQESNTTDGDLLVALKAMIGEIIALERTGDQAESERQRRLLGRMLCGCPAPVKKEFCDYLDDIGEDELARDTLERLLRFSAFGADEEIDFGRVAIGYGSLLEADSPAEAARWQDLALAGTLETMAYYARGYLILPAQHLGLRARAAAARGDAAAVGEYIRRSLRLYPMNINMAEDLFTELREAGLDQQADEGLTQIFAVGRAHLARFPQDAEDANNLAWTAAMSGRRLDEALELARRACFLRPDSVSYRDTLAEVLYQRGNRREALIIERHCLLDDPDMWHLHEQIEKFEEGEE